MADLDNFGPDLVWIRSSEMGSSGSELGTELIEYVRESSQKTGTVYTCWLENIELKYIIEINIFFLEDD